MQPAFPAFGEGCDVSGGVEVAMQSEITDLAFEVPAVSVSSADVSTTVAGLGSVVAKVWKFAKRFWSPSYYVGTAGTVSEETIKKYIAEQETRASPLH